MPVQGYTQPFISDGSQKYSHEHRHHDPLLGPPPPHEGATHTGEGSKLVPDSELSEQRETLEQFEMSRGQPETESDRDIATLQKEFPTIDGSLVAAMYGDSKSVSATRELLHELVSQSKGEQ